MKLHLSNATTAVAFFIFAVAIVAKPHPLAREDCAEICWENSKYVSNCGREVDCLCNDAGFQNAVYQCVYAQCHTSQYGHALYHALAACPSDERDVGQIPQLFSHDSLKHRGFSQSGFVSGSASASYSATRSGSYRSGGASASASARPTRSVARGSASGSFVRMSSTRSPTAPTPT